MLKYILSGCITLYMTFPACAQISGPIKYKDEVFSTITVRRNLSYDSTATTGKKNRSTLFDLYQPKDDGAGLRPLIIWMHGGGFKFGSKEAAGIQLWSTTFAHRGYVCAAINYRMGSKGLRFHFNDLVKGCYDAVQDAQTAIAWFRANAIRLRIDTNRIVLAGNSAGGMIALQAAYSINAEMLHLIGDDDSGLVSHAIDAGHIAAVVNFWGGIFHIDWLQNARVPIVSVHGKKDGVVPYDHKGYPLYGSFAIHRTADSLHIPNQLKTYDDYSHELQKHFNPLIVSGPTKKRWLEAGQFAADFLYNELFKDRESARREERDAGGGSGGR
jgi:acetyl esterase/lipase